MAVEDWERSERGLAFAIDEAKRYLRRSRPKLVWLIILGLLSGGGYAVKRAMAKRTYEGQIVMRIVEADKDLTEQVKPPHEYLNLIWGAFLSGPHLKELIEKQHLYPDKFARDPQLAIEAMRDELEVEVWRNYFSGDYFDPNEARSVRFSVTWRGRDPEVALNVIHALGKVIMDAEAEERRAIFELGQRDVLDASENALRRLAVVRQAIALRQKELERAAPARQQRLLVELRDLRSEEKVQQERLTSLGNARTRFDITAAWERQRSGIRFEIIEGGVVLPLKMAGPIATACTSVVVGLLAVFLGGMVLGAFEVKVRQSDDVRRLGVPLLGVMPAFPGDTVGALTERLRAEDRLRLERR